VPQTLDGHTVPAMIGRVLDTSSLDQSVWAPLFNSSHLAAPPNAVALFLRCN
jgi:hypothetical protein